jgi:aminoglycoside phosphotransferase (APT) family kinase protein
VPHDPILSAGVSLDRLGAFIRSHRPGLLDGQLRATLIAGGRSNLTYLVTDGTGTHMVLRRPPMSHLLPTAHNMFREYTILKALRRTGIPVPLVFEYCGNPDVIGAPFYLMEYAPGSAFRRVEQLAALGPTRTARICECMVDTLASLHSVVPVDVGLANFGRPVGFLARQVARWKGQLDASRTRELPGADELYKLLASDVPQESSASIVHGDYRLDNLLYDERDSVTAVLDWEMATLGDPFADVALLVAYRMLTAELNIGSDSNNAAAAPGFLTGDQMLERYCAQSGLQIPPMGFYLGLAYFKIVTIIEGVIYRDAQDQAVGDVPEDVGVRIEPLIAAGLTALREKT